MTHIIDTEPQAETQTEAHQGLPNFDMFASGVATGLVVTTIFETGRSAVGILAKNPLVVLGAGIMTGYFAHKYRKQIILSSNKVAEHSKDFVSRQKKHFSELLGETEEN